MSEHAERVFASIKVGDKLIFHPSTGRWPWTVRARNDRFIVATTPWPFRKKGTLAYTVVDLTGWQDKFYNFAGRGVVRSSLDWLGGGFGDGTYSDEQCEKILAELVAGESDLSVRRVLNVHSVDIVSAS